MHVEQKIKVGTRLLEVDPGVFFSVTAIEIRDGFTYYDIEEQNGMYNITIDEEDMNYYFMVVEAKR